MPMPPSCSRRAADRATREQRRRRRRHAAATAPATRCHRPLHDAAINNGYRLLSRGIYGPAAAPLYAAVMIKRRRGLCYFFVLRSSDRKLVSTIFDQSTSPLSAPTSFCARIIRSMPAISKLPGPQYVTPDLLGATRILDRALGDVDVEIIGLGDDIRGLVRMRVHEFNRLAPSTQDSADEVAFRGGGFGSGHADDVAQRR